MTIYDLLALGKAYLILFFAANIIISLITLYRAGCQKEWTMVYIMALFAVPIGIFAFCWTLTINI